MFLGDTLACVLSFCDVGALLETLPCVSRAFRRCIATAPLARSRGRAPRTLDLELIDRRLVESIVARRPPWSRVETVLLSKFGGDSTVKLRMLLPLCSNPRERAISRTYLPHEALVAALQDCSQLRALQLDMSIHGDQALQAVCALRPELTALSLRSCPRMTDGKHPTHRAALLGAGEA